LAHKVYALTKAGNSMNFQPKVCRMKNYRWKIK
jgi:hypothetical protein